MAEYKTKNISRAAEKIMGYLDCPCEVFAALGDDEEMLETYKLAVEEGRARGETPLLIVPDETLLEHLSLDFEGGWQDFEPRLAARRRAEILREAEGLEAQAILDELKRGVISGPLGRHCEPGPVEGDNIISYFSAYWDYGANRTCEAILARIPTARPWELAAWLPMGGFNDCPPPEAQVAVMKRWHEKFGAVPAVVSCDTWEFTVPDPPPEVEAALELAYEHFAFCPDRVEQYSRDEYRVGNLADSLMKSPLWYFWWD